VFSGDENESILSANNHTSNAKYFIASYSCTPTITTTMTFGFYLTWPSFLELPKVKPDFPNANIILICDAAGLLRMDAISVTQQCQHWSR